MVFNIWSDIKHNVYFVFTFLFYGRLFTYVALSFRWKGAISESISSRKNNLWCVISSLDKDNSKNNNPSTV